DDPFTGPSTYCRRWSAPRIIFPLPHASAQVTKHEQFRHGLLGADLAAILSKEASLPAGLALDDAAELYAEQVGVDKLIDKLKMSFSAKAVAECHRQIADIPWRRAYTTNYDDVFELACSNIGKRVHSVVPLDDISQISKKNLLCVHLNGLIRRTDEDSVWNDLKLTQRSYDSGSAMDSDWGSLFRADLQAAQAVFFVGYSLWDLDIRRLLFGEQLIDKSFFVLGQDPDMATAHRAAKYGLLIAAGTPEFANQLTDFRKTYVPEQDPTPISFCLASYGVEVAPVSMEDRNVFDLLLFGWLRPELVAATFLARLTIAGLARRMSWRLHE
ncbi:MAG: SIR2 family protein, partial [Candidatus Sulfotelmatobacter sp.]